MNERENRAEDLLNVAANYAGDGNLLCSDVSAMVFPRGQIAPSEEMLSAVSQKLRSLVYGIEAALLNDSAPTDQIDPVSWELLARSGFLREAPLIDFVLARYSEDRLLAKILVDREFEIADLLPVRLLASSEPVLASTAQTLLAANSMQKHPGRLLHREMGAELLHQLCWRIVAALQVAMGRRDIAVLDNAKELLGNYDESKTVNAAARKAVHFLSSEQLIDCAYPAKAGLHLFTALIASESGLDQDHILRLIDGPDSAPLAVLLRLTGLARDEAMAAICLFKGFGLTPREIGLFDANYDQLSKEQARDAAQKWALSRARFLAFPNLQEASDT